MTEAAGSAYETRVKEQERVAAEAAEKAAAEKAAAEKAPEETPAEEISKDVA